MLNRKFVAAVCTLTGAIIGAGVLGIPYVTVRAGFWTGMLALVVVGAVLLILNLMIGEISLRSKKSHHLAGYAEKYVGTSGKFWMIAAMAISCYSALIAYTLGVSKSLQALFGGAQVWWAFGFYALMVILLYGSLNMLAGSEIYIEFTKLVVFIALLFVMFGSASFQPSALQGFSWSFLLYPVGVILFACIGITAVPFVRDILKDLKRVRDVIVAGSVIPVVTYAVFAAAVIGITGAYTTEVATIGVAHALRSPASWFLHVFAILAMASSFIALGYALKWSLKRDFGLRNSEAWLLTLTIPPVAIVLGATSFVRTIDIGGSLAAGIAGCMVLVMHARARRMGQRRPEYAVPANNVVYVLIAALLGVAVLHALVSAF